jgi:alpha-1,3-glucosyltransferase
MICAFDSKWYYNSSKNDLDYWGLDYPPLSAFHSFGLGKIFKKILPESIKLTKSRGYESPMLKFLMRLSVVASDLLIPALVAFHLKFSNPRRRFATWVTGRIISG